jgi:hypothetical protein
MGNAYRPHYEGGKRIAAERVHVLDIFPELQAGLKESCCKGRPVHGYEGSQCHDLLELSNLTSKPWLQTGSIWIRLFKLPLHSTESIDYMSWPYTSQMVLHT